MATTNINVRVDNELKAQAEALFADLGLNMSTAINMFLRSAVSHDGLPFEAKRYMPNETTAAAIEEGRRIASDKSVKGYTNMDDLRAALEV